MISYMKVLFFLFFSLFSVSSFAQPVGVTVLSDMYFPDQVQGVAVNVILQPTDPGAATFSISGRPNRLITCSVLNSSVNITTPGGSGAQYRIRVRNFVINGCTRIGPTGVLNGVSIGARAIVNSNDEEGDYSGVNTLRVLYN